jgi:hypothetical protein
MLRASWRARLRRAVFSARPASPREIISLSFIPNGETIMVYTYVVRDLRRPAQSPLNLLGA